MIILILLCFCLRYGTVTYGSLCLVVFPCILNTHDVHAPVDEYQELPGMVFHLSLIHIFLDFKDKFSRNYTLASDRFSKAIDEIDKTIDHLQKVKDNLLSSENNLRLANNKLDDLTIKRLTRGNKMCIRDRGRVLQMCALPDKIPPEAF